MKFPTLPSPQGTRQTIQVTFRGIETLPGANNGAIRDMCNLYPDATGVLSRRPAMVTLGTVTSDWRYNEQFLGICTHENTLYYAKGRYEDRVVPVPVGEPLPEETTVRWYFLDLYRADGSASGTTWTQVASAQGTNPGYDEECMFASLGRRLIIFPAKLVYDPESQTMQSLEASEVHICTFPEEGSYAGELALNNTITISTSGETWADVRVGDYVTVSYTGTPGPNAGKGGIIREIDGQSLRFDEGIFVTETTPAEITVNRDVPDLDIMFAHSNRLWGAKGNTIYASKLGDPFNWNVFDGLSTDSWAWDTLTNGDITGGCSYLGFPVFFKASQVMKIYGNDANRFQVEAAPDVGVAVGCKDSVAIAGNRVFYLSPIGVMEYGGIHPTLVSRALGEGPWKNGRAGSDGTHYYIQMEDITGNRRMYVYNTGLGTWHTEARTRYYSIPDERRYVNDRAQFCTIDGVMVVAMTEDLASPRMSYTQIYTRSRIEPADSGHVLAGIGEESESDIMWHVEFGDFTTYMQKSLSGSANKKWIGKLLLRMVTEPGETVYDPYITIIPPPYRPFHIYIQYDSSGTWSEVFWSTGPEAGSWYLAIVPRRCDHFRLKITGDVAFALHSLTLEICGGSPNKL